MPVATLLEMAATNNGFDRDLPVVEGWLGFRSTKAPLKIWLTIRDNVDYIAAFSQFNVAKSLGEHGSLTTIPLPNGAIAARVVGTLSALHQMLRRAFQLSKTLPDELLHAFEKKTAKLPQSTEIERLVVQRVGQDLFRAGLLEYWEGRCPITRLAVPALLRASHIKPWADCETNAERLDVFNGLLLAPHFDAAFDRGFMTVSDDGAVVLSSALSGDDRTALGFGEGLRVDGLTDGHRKYLVWHRGRVFRLGSSP